MTRAAQIVERKVAEARAYADQVIAPASTKRVGADGVREAFRSLFPPGTRHWSNFSNEMPVWQQLMTGPPVLLDLSPISDMAFERLYGITRSEALDLAQRKIIIPNVYFRNPEDWDRSGNISPDLEALLDISFATSEVTDFYLDFKQRERADGKNFRDVLNYRSQDLLEKLKSIDAAHIEKLAEVIGTQTSRVDDLSQLPSYICHVVAHNYAALHALAPQNVISVIDDLLDQPSWEGLREGMMLVRVMKQKHSSPVTAALGGVLVIPKYVRRLAPSDWIGDETRDLTANREILEYLYGRCELALKELYSRVPSRPETLETLASHDFRDRGQLIWELQERVGHMVRTGQLESAAVDDLERLYAEHSHQLSRASGQLALGIQVGGASLGFVGALMTLASERFDFAVAVASATAAVAGLAKPIARQVTELDFATPDRSAFVRRTRAFVDMALAPAP